MMNGCEVDVKSDKWPLALTFTGIVLSRSLISSLQIELMQELLNQQVGLNDIKGWIAGHKQKSSMAFVVLKVFEDEVECYCCILDPSVEAVRTIVGQEAGYHAIPE